MSEYCTEAIVLGRYENGHQNFFADLYTQELGRVEARVISGRKITSKLSPHLDSGTFVFVRLVHKNQFTLADAMFERRFLDSTQGDDDFFRLARLCRFLLPFGVPDLELWNFFVHNLREGKINYTMFLSLLGYGMEEASCARCSRGGAQAFFLSDQTFLCDSCASNHSFREAVRFA